MRSLIALCLLAWVSTTQAQTTPLLSYCADVHRAAEAAMQDRQNGYDMATLLRLADGNEVAEAIVIQAFQVPRYRNLDDRMSAIDTFASYVFDTCLEHFSPSKAP